MIRTMDRSGLDREWTPSVSPMIYHTISLSFAGTITAGKTVIIDGEKYTVLNDSVNAIANFSGDFPRIAPGNNVVGYSDSEPARTVQLTVLRSDRRA